MRRYLQRMQEERTTHERRQFAVRTAGVVTAVLFVTWAGSLGLRLANPGAGNPSATGSSNSQTAAVVHYQEQTNNLEVATTSVFGQPGRGN